MRFTARLLITVAGGTLGTNRGFWTMFSTRLRTGICTIHSPVHISLGEKLVSIHMMKDIKLRKAHSFSHLQVGGREELVARVVAYPTSEFPDLSCECFHVFVTLLLHQVLHVDQMLMYTKASPMTGCEVN